MKFEFPDTGEGVTEGKFLEWKVKEGDSVEEDQILGEAETDKAVVDIPAPADGTVKELKASPGDNVEVGQVIMILNTASASAEEEDSGNKAEKSEEPVKQDKEEKVQESEGKDFPPGKSSNILALPKVRKLAERKNVNLSSIKTGERITRQEVLDAGGQEEESETEKNSDSEPKDKVNATPSVRKLAREKGINIQTIDGSVRGGKITRDDVLNEAENEVKEDEDGKTVEANHKRLEVGEDERKVDMSQVRKTVGERMTESRFTAPHVTHFDTADVTELVELREERKDKVEPHLTYLPFIMKAVYLAMKNYPKLNSELDEEDNSIVLKGHYDFNIAVDTEEGLMVPLVKDVDDKNIVELASEVSKKAEKARDGALSKDEMRNGTFSITNQGVVGGEEFTPIINYPQTAILGIGKIEETAEVVDGKVKPRTTVKLSLSYDHRVIDGADAARFMNNIIENLEEPENMILEL